MLNILREGKHFIFFGNPFDMNKLSNELMAMKKVKDLKEPGK